MGRLHWSGTTRKGGGRRGGTLKLGKGSGTGVVVPSEQYSTREGGGGTSCTDVITWQGGGRQGQEEALKPHSSRERRSQSREEGRQTRGEKKVEAYLRGLYYGGGDKGNT